MLFNNMTNLVKNENERYIGKHITMPKYMWKTIEEKRGIIPRSCFIANILHGHFYGNTKDKGQ